MDIANYQPSQAAMARARDVSMIVVVGPSGVGKTTLINAAVQQDPNVYHVVSTTSRPPRDGEQDGVDYHFCTRQEMLQKIEHHEYLNVGQGLNDLYATHPDDLPPQGAIGIMAIFALSIPDFQKLFPHLRVIFTIPRDYGQWESRLSTRHFTPEQRARRLTEARESLQFALQHPDMLFVVNDDLAIAQQEFLRLVEHKPLTPDQQIEQQRARSIAADLLAHVAAMLQNQSPA